MPLNAEVFSDFKKRINDWANVAETGGNVTNFPLDLANRAQNWLTLYKPWTEQLKTATLTMDGNVASLPSDYGVLVDIRWDSNSDGKPEGYWYKDGRLQNGYTIKNAFTKAVGHNRSITFFNTLSQTPILLYQYALADFVDSDAAEYTFFPGELLYRTAQRLHIVDSGMTSAEQLIILKEQEQQLKDYTQSHHLVNSELRLAILDDLGREVGTWDVDLTREGQHGGAIRRGGLSNSTDLRW